MNKNEVARYFNVLSKLFPHPCTVILTGAGAGAVYGRVRATMDLDFALKLEKDSSSKTKQWQEFETASKEAALRTGIVAQYAEDIDRWSLITYLDYENHAIPFRRFGSLNVKLLEPCYWAIGKLARYLDPDVRDLIDVLKRTGTRPEVLSPILGTALKKSPKSTACYLFRRQVEDFFRSYGKRIWGREFSPESVIKNFHDHAGIKS
jgi:hypothetical protein